MDTESTVKRVCKWESCDAPCAWEYLEGQGQPCWGEIQIVEFFDDPEGGTIHIHGCQGHEDMWMGNYTPEPKHENKTGV